MHLRLRIHNYVILYIESVVMSELLPMAPGFFKPLALELDIHSLAHHLCKIWTKKGNIRKYKTFCGGINEDGERKSKKIIKYICWLNT